MGKISPSVQLIGGEMTESINVQGELDVNSSFGELAACEHIAQFYEHDSILIGTLIVYIGGALSAGDSAIVIATEEHLRALEQGLHESGVDVVSALIQGCYIPLLADETLRRFMVKEWPDEKLFTDFATELITRARGNGRQVRAFGEMVALLWSRGNVAATVRLEQLWQQLCKIQEFALLCAYPRARFTDDAGNSVREICAAHSRVI